MRRFELHRDQDVNGQSGVGVVAEGVVFTDGRCAMRWRTEIATSVFFDSIDDVGTIHGHNGRTRIVYLDDDEGMETNPELKEAIAGKLKELRGAVRGLESMVGHAMKQHPRYKRGKARVRKLAGTVRIGQVGPIGPIAGGYLPGGPTE